MSSRIMIKLILLLSISFGVFCKESEITERKINLNGRPSVKIDKVSMTQKGYIQFLRYITDVPPIGDFTFCIWIRSNNLTYSHPLLSYSRHESERLIRAWITPNGNDIKLALRDLEIFKVHVGFKENQWYHICQSWSTKTGHWDLFLNGKLKAHGFNERARGQILTKEGDIVVGQEYTDFDKGLDDGIEGDIFGFNMILASASSPQKQKYVLDKPFNFIRRRISHSEKPKGEFLVQSGSLLLRRKSKSNDGLPTHDDEEKNYKFNIEKDLEQNSDKFPSEDLILNQEEFEIPTKFSDINLGTKFILDDKQFESSTSSSFEEVFLSTRRKRQNNDFFSLPYIRFADFNPTPKTPLFRPSEPTFYNFKNPSQYAIQHQYTPPDILIPPSPKISRIANEIPFGEVNQKPLGLQLVELGYNCLAGRGAPLRNVLISWTKTPVRVFGGAVIKQGEPFCV